jgi:hypothetical protein
MASEVANGSQTATVGVEHSLSTQSTVGVYMGKINLANMVAGDEVEIRVKDKARSAQSAREEAIYGIYSGAQSQDVIWTEALLSSSWELTLKQTAGTGRVFEWGVYSP